MSGMERRLLDYAPPPGPGDGPTVQRPIVGLLVVSCALFLVLAGVAALSDLGRPRGRPSRGAMARLGVHRLSAALDAFAADVGRYPTTAEGLNALLAPPAGAGGWRRPYIDAVTADPFGNPHVYVDTSNPSTGQLSYLVVSVGPDGRGGTADDYGISGGPVRQR